MHNKYALCLHDHRTCLLKRCSLKLLYITFVVSFVFIFFFWHENNKKVLIIDLLRLNMMMVLPSWNRNIWNEPKRWPPQRNAIGSLTPPNHTKTSRQLPYPLHLSLFSATRKGKNKKRMRWIYRKSKLRLSKFASHARRQLKWQK